MKMKGHLVLLSLALFDGAAALSASLRGRNSTITQDETTAWDTHLEHAVGSVFAPHAVNTECSARLGKWWSLPQSDVAVRHNLIPGATVIFEVGGNIGEDLAQYVWRFPQAKVFTYEPVPELYQTLVQKFGTNPNVKITQVGVSNSDRVVQFTVGGKHGEGSSHANTTAWGTKINVNLRDANALLTEVTAATGKVPDVVSINCEGCEYEVLGRMAQTGWLGKVPFVQLSWHVVGGVPDRLGQRCAIEQYFWKFYDPAYHALYGWQGWKLKPPAASFLQQDGIVASLGYKETDDTDDDPVEDEELEDMGIADEE